MLNRIKLNKLCTFFALAFVIDLENWSEGVIRLTISKWNYKTEIRKKRNTEIHFSLTLDIQWHNDVNKPTTTRDVCYGPTFVTLYAVNCYRLHSGNSYICCHHHAAYSICSEYEAEISIESMIYLNGSLVSARRQTI